MRLILSGILLICSTVNDIRRREISGILMGIFLILALVCLFFGKSLSLVDALLGIIPGILLVILSLLTGGELGMGDGILICVLGLLMGLRDNVILLLGGLFFSAFFSIFLVIRGNDFKKEYPFVPFLLLSFVFMKLTGN